MAGEHRVEPSNAPRAAGGAAKFVTFLAHRVGESAANFAWEGTAANPGGVCFADAEHRVQTAWSNTRAAEDGAGAAIGRSHERISPVIDIEHYSVRAFK